MDGGMLVTREVSIVNILLLSDQSKVFYVLRCHADSESEVALLMW